MLDAISAHKHTLTCPALLCPGLRTRYGLLCYKPVLRLADSKAAALRFGITFLQQAPPDITCVQRALPHAAAYRAELGIDLGGIWKRTRGVLAFRMGAPEMQDLDVGGPLLFSTILGVSHLLVGPTHNMPIQKQFK